MPFPRTVACYKTDNNYNEYVRGGMKIKVMDVIMGNITRKKLAGHLGTVFECVVAKEHC